MLRSELTLSSRTGATGYIGGETLHRITKLVPNAEITALARDVQKGKQVSSAYPDVHIVHGDLDDSHVIEKAASEADIVVRKSSALDSSLLQVRGKTLRLAQIMRRPAT